jgi:prepilin-type N-terminal cleavage/methylation domain-containing protein
MLRRNARGFTLVEMLVVMVVLGIVVISSYTYFSTSTAEYLNLQKDSLAFNDLAYQSQRISKVLRGLTDISVANTNNITVYAYFSPDDTYVSQVSYYKNAEGTKLFADVTPMNGNPPTGTLLSSQKKTYTIMDNFLTLASTNVFEYLDSTGDPLALPISDLHIIKGITVNLAVPVNAPTAKGNHTMSVQVSLRNRKTNL